MLNKDKCLLAKYNYFKGVKEVIKSEYPKNKLLVGVKDVKEIPASLISKLELFDFAFHTLDNHSLGGRAIDLNLINPITGRYMTGSSSGTAINVLVGINDLGVGTDGGGSVLGPAIALNLFSFISPLIENDFVSQFSKVSTDGIEFSPSIGFITSDFDILKQAVFASTEIVAQVGDRPITIIIDRNEHYYNTVNDNIVYEKVDFCYHNRPRKILIDFLNNHLENCDLLIFNESRIDLDGFGDSVFGNFDAYTKDIQTKANKGFLRVCNLVNATAISIPKTELASAYLIICESKPEKIAAALFYASSLVTEGSELVKNYFHSTLNYRNEFKKEE